MVTGRNTNVSNNTAPDAVNVEALWPDVFMSARQYSQGERLSCIHFKPIWDDLRRIDLFVERDANMCIFFATGGPQSK